MHKRISVKDIIASSWGVIMQEVCSVRRFGTIFLFAILCSMIPIPASAQNSAPVVTNVTAFQIEGTGFVQITYDVSDADGDFLTASLICSSDNGTTFDLLPVTVSGDVHRPMAAGTGKQILWNAATDYPGRYWSQVVAKVVVSDGPTTSGEMVFVPAGEFTMGSTAETDEQPVHVVYLDAFYIDKYEVTNAEFAVFIDAGGYNTQAFWSAEGWAYRLAANWTQPSSWESGEYHSGPSWPGFPVRGISYYEAEAYANFVGKRLPTEAEWEKAARGTDQRIYPWGNSLDGSRANYYESGDPFDNFSTPIGFYDGRLFPNPPFQTNDSPGPYGTYDQSGNVREWVKDWYSATYYSESPQSNPLGPISGGMRVLRGGECIDLTTDNLRSAGRWAYYPYARYATCAYGQFSFGIRCVRNP